MKKIIFILVLLFKIIKWPVFICLSILMCILSGHLLNLFSAYFFNFPLQVAVVMTNYWYFLLGAFLMCASYLLYQIIIDVIPIIMRSLKKIVIDSRYISENINKK